jgi:hypothetical protein
MEFKYYLLILITALVFIGGIVAYNLGYSNGATDTTYANFSTYCSQTDSNTTGKAQCDAFCQKKWVECFQNR